MHRNKTQFQKKPKTNIMMKQTTEQNTKTKTTATATTKYQTHKKGNLSRGQLNKHLSATGEYHIYTTMYLNPQSNK